MNKVSEVEKLTLRTLVGILHYLITPEAEDDELLKEDLRVLIKEIIDFAKKHPED